MKIDRSFAYKLSGKIEAVKNIAKGIVLSVPAGQSLCQTAESKRNPLFKSVEIETTSICNRKCTYCPNYSNQRQAGYMEESLFYKVIDELAEINFSGRFSPHFYGEPLLDKRIVAFMSYARKKLPDAYMKFFTNGDFLTYDMFTGLLDAGVDNFRIAQHDDQPSKTINETLKKIDDKTFEERVEYEKYFNNDKFLMSRGGLIEVKHDLKMKFCDYVSGITIDYEGNMLLCCQDYTSRYIFGNLKNEKILDVWNKRQYKFLRDKIKCGIWPLDICRICNGMNTIDFIKGA